jgi:flagellar hook-basal body protein
MGSFSTSLSGLDAEVQALSVISNDLSNLNTTAFKTGTPVFSNLFYQMLGTDGAGDPVQVGVGATMSSVSSPMTQGSVTTTGVPTDVAIQGNGLFILDQNGSQVYTRAGNFTLSPNGDLTDTSGNNVMGYAAVNGVINTSGTLSPMVIATGQTYPPNPTTTMQLDLNLDATDSSLATATGSLTVPQPVPTAGQTVSVGGTTYTFATAITPQSAADTVLIGADVGSTLANLAGAINASTTNGQAAGTTYGTGTVANATVTATSTTAGTLNLQAINAGALGNSDGTTTDWAEGSFGATDLTGGITVQTATSTFTAPAALPNPGDTLTIGANTYTFVAAAADLTSANDVLIDPGNSVATTLANLAGAITASTSNGQGAGTTYGTGTVASTDVTVTGSTASTISLQAANAGAAGDTVPTSTTWGGGAFDVSDLAGGSVGVQATATLTVPAATQPTAGQTVTVGATTYTFAAAITGQSTADTVLIGPDVTHTLANLAGAINASTTNGQSAGTTYGTGTVANTSVSATGSDATTVTLQAVQSGVAGNTIAASTTWTGGGVTAADLTGGVNTQLATGALTVPLPLPTAGETVTVGDTTYTFAASITGQSPADTVLIGADVTSTLANLAGAINAASTNGQAAGTTYSTGTIANASVTATGSTATALNLQSVQSGSAGNSVNTSTTWASGAFGSSDLTGGADAGTYSTPITVYDSLGNSHVLTFSFTKSAAGEWNYQITIPAADVGASGAAQVVTSGTLQFGPNGNLISPAADVTGITVNGLADGAKPMSLNWQLFSSPGTAVLTQTAATSAQSGTTQNGYSSGTLQSYSINSDGVIEGVLSNDQTVSLGQIALATFPNYDGLTNLGSNDYRASLASGAASVSVPGTGGSGTLAGSSLEASNVDIATAFTELIQAERGYEANAKAITTADDVMQASIALIQS